MKQDKEAQKKIIVLVLAVLLVGYIVYTIISSGRTVARVAKSIRTSTDTAEAPTTDSKTLSNGVVPNIVFPGLDIPSPRRDPFSIQDSELSMTKSPVAGSSKVPKMPAITRNPLKPFNPFSSLKNMSAPLPKIGKLTIIPPEQPTLSGVIMGPNNVAILNYGGKTYVVDEGSFFAGRYRLLRVTKNSVVLQNKSTQIHIGLGGSK